MCACPHSNKPTTPTSKTGTVVLETGKSTYRVEVEVVSTPALRAKGLKYRKKLGAHKGMLFLFDQEEIQSFWMQDTYIPLDMIFINKSKKIVGILENTAPLTETSRRVDAASIYVLEVNGGFCRSRGISVGTTVRFEGVM